MNIWLDMLLAASLGAVLLYMMFIFPTQWLKIEWVAYPLGLKARILQISDLHVDMLRVSPRQLKSTIDLVKPDYIFLTGDYTYKTSFLPKLKKYAEVLAGSGVPVYAVLGNHDHQLPNLRRLVELFHSNGIQILRNESIDLHTFELVGIDNYSTGHSRIPKAFSGVTGRKPVVVITHDPNVVLSINSPYSYLLSGHLHGKQLNVPFFFALKPKGPLPASGIYKGFHKRANGALYISKGIGQAGVNARFMVRSEVTVHEL